MSGSLLNQRGLRFRDRPRILEILKGLLPLSPGIVQLGRADRLVTQGDAHTVEPRVVVNRVLSERPPLHLEVKDQIEGTLDLPIDPKHKDGSVPDRAGRHPETSGRGKPPLERYTPGFLFRWRAIAATRIDLNEQAMERIRRLGSCRNP